MVGLADGFQDAEVPPHDESQLPPEDSRKLPETFMNIMMNKPGFNNQPGFNN